MATPLFTQSHDVFQPLQCVGGKHVQANKGGNRKLCWGFNSVPSVGTKTDIGTWTLDS